MRWLLCSLLLVPLLAATPARAETLLAEIGWNQPDPITLPASFVPSRPVRAPASITSSIYTPEQLEVITIDDYFEVRDFPHNIEGGVGISTSLTSPDQNEVMTIIDDPFSIARFNSVLAVSSSTLRRAYITNDGQIINPPFGHSPFDAIWGQDTDPNDGYHPAAYVPRLGNGLQGYWLSSVKQVVTPAGQTVYFYGGLIPEPSTWLLMLLGGLHVSTRSCRLRL